MSPVKKAIAPLLRNTLLGFTAATAVLVLGSAVFYQSLRAQQSSEVWVRHTGEVLTQLTKIEAKLATLKAQHRGYLLTGNATYLQPYEVARTELLLAVDELRRLVQDNPQQLTRWERLNTLLTNKLLYLDQNIRIYQQQGQRASIKALESQLNRGLSYDLRNQLDLMKQTERHLLRQRLDNVTRFSRQAQGIFILGLVNNILILLATALVVVRQIQARQIATADGESGNQFYRSDFPDHPSLDPGAGWGWADRALESLL
jgi:CHASE3 domain sensor protein